MLTYRTGSAGAGQTARFMAEHLLQQTLPPEMAVMADYYEQGVTPPTTGEAAAGRYAHLTVDGKLPDTDLDHLLSSEVARLTESAVGQDGRGTASGELHLRAIATFAAAGLIDPDQAQATLGRLTDAGREQLEAAIEDARTTRDYSSATAAPRRDMNPKLAKRLGINTTRGLTTDEVAHLLNGQRADGKPIEGKAVQSATLPLSAIFGLDPDHRPTRTEISRILSGETVDGEALPEKDVERAVNRFAAALGVNVKTPTAEHRENILSGRMADGTELTDPAYKVAVETSKSRIGYIDLTFSAPKSFSVAWAFAPTSAERAILHRAHARAIEDTLALVEKEIGQARIGKGGKDGAEPGSIGWVSFNHYAARPTVEVIRPDANGRQFTELHTLTGTGGRVPGDMQVHTHVAIFNAVETASGRVGGLDLAQLEGRIHEWGALYQAFLAKALRKNGVEVGLDAKNEMACLTAIPQSVTAEFSKRTVGGTEAARAYAESQGLNWDELDPARKVGLLKAGVQNPREAKTDDVSDLAAWKMTADKIGYQARSVLRPDEVQPDLAPADRLEMAYQAALALLDKQFDQRAVVGSSDVRVAAAKGLIAAGIDTAEDVNTLTRAFRERGIRRRGEDTNLIWGQVAGSQGREKIAITTSLEKREEEILIATAHAGGQDKSAALTKQQIEEAVAAFPSINFENEHGKLQRDIINKLGAGGRVSVAIGVAGSGKSTLLKPLVQAWKDDGRVVYGLALAWRQADDMGDAGIEKGYIRAVDPFLKSLERNSLKLDRKTVLVVDEVGLLGTRQLNDILAAQKKYGFQLVMIGDPKQMQAVEAGPVIELLQRGLGIENVPELKSSVRQKEAEERETTLMFREGKAAEAIDRKVANGTLEIVPGGYREAIMRIANLWQQRTGENVGRKDFSVTVSAATNAEAHDISKEIRARRRAMGEVGPDQITVQAADIDGVRKYDMPLAQGDRVRLFRATHATFAETGATGSIGRNGSVLTVRGITEAGLTLLSSTGKEGFVPWSRLEKDGRKLLAYGDALTSNTSQGSTVTEHIHAMPSGTRAVTAFGAYTSGSRHKEHSFIVVSEGAERSEVAGRRPLGDQREVAWKDLLDNIKRNLSRQPEKESYHSFIEKAANVHQGTVEALQKSHYRIEAVKAAGGELNLGKTFSQRRVSRIMEKALPSLTARLQRQCEALAKMTRAAGIAILAHMPIVSSSSHTGQAPESSKPVQTTSTTEAINSFKPKSRHKGL